MYRVISVLAVVGLLATAALAADPEKVVPKSNQTPVRITDPDGRPVYPGNATNQSVNVTVLAAPAAPPVLNPAGMNPLLYEAGRQSYCAFNLCPPPVGGLNK